MRRRLVHVCYKVEAGKIIALVSCISALNHLRNFLWDAQYVLLLYVKNYHSAATLYLESLFDIAVSGFGVFAEECVQLIPRDFPGSCNRPVFPCMLWPLDGKILIASL